MSRVYDVVIAGLGISGLAFLRQLYMSDRDFSALVIEREKIWHPWEEPEASERSTEYRLPSIETHITYRDPGSETPPSSINAWWTSRRAGGGFNRWYGQLSRFRQSDFDGTYGQEWPVTLAEMEPWYDVVESDLLPFGCSYGFTQEQYASFDCRYFQNRSETSLLERFTVDEILGANLHGYIGQSVLGGRLWEDFPVDPRSLSVSTGHPLAIRPNYYAMIMSEIVHDDRFTLLDDASVKYFEPRSGKRPLVIHTDRLPLAPIRAHSLVLSCGPLNSVPVLMLSGLPNRNKALGQGITFTLERVGYGLIESPRSSTDLDELVGRFSSTVVKSFYTYDDDSSSMKGGKFALYDAFRIESDARRRQQLDRALTDSDAFMSREYQGQQSIKISFKGESDVSNSKRIVLAGRVPVVEYHPHVNDLRRHAAVEDQMTLLARVLGCQQLHLQPIPAGVDLISAHHHGGAMFALDPDRAVVTSECECIEAPGVFVADASFMPTSGGTNSSLTVMANARRVAQAWLNRGWS